MNKQEAIDSLECFRRNTAHILGDNDEKVKTIETCMMLVREAEETERWIPVSERLPEELTTVLITDKDGDVFLATFIEVINGCAEWTTDGIIAWMPLPEPYKEGENGTGSL